MHCRIIQENFIIKKQCLIHKNQSFLYLCEAENYLVVNNPT